MTTISVKEYPILFKPHLVRAILDGRKTVTFRPIDQRNSTVQGYSANGYWSCLRFGDAKAMDDSTLLMAITGKREPGRDVHLSVPFAAPGDEKLKSDDLGWYRVRPIWEAGDRLWVRETWAHTNDYDGNIILDKRKALYKADDCEPTPSRWRPSIHMPRLASRINLELTDVRPMRAHKITDADVLADGIDQVQIDKWKKWLHKDDVHAHAFGESWDTIYARRGYPWASNPWVWRLEFKKL